MDGECSGDLFLGTKFEIQKGFTESAIFRFAVSDRLIYLLFGGPTLFAQDLSDFFLHAWPSLVGLQIDRGIISLRTARPPRSGEPDTLANLPKRQNYQVTRQFLSS